MSYTKLFHKLLASSIWNEDLVTRVVWITMLCMKNQSQIVEGSMGGIAHMARVPIGDCAKAIAKLEGPDPDDSSGVREGRRLEKLENGGWLVINGGPYRDAKDEDERRAYMAKYMREYRKRKQDVNNHKPSLTLVNTSEQSRAEQSKEESHTSKGDEGSGEKDFALRSETGSIEPKKQKMVSSRPKDYEELLEQCLKQGLKRDDALWLWAKWMGNGFKNGGKTMVRWKAVVVQWKIAGHFPSQKQNNSNSR